MRPDVACTPPRIRTAVTEGHRNVPNWAVQRSSGKVCFLRHESGRSMSMNRRGSRSASSSSGVAEPRRALATDLEPSECKRSDSAAVYVTCRDASGQVVSRADGLGSDECCRPITRVQNVEQAAKVLLQGAQAGPVQRLRGRRHGRVSPRIEVDVKAWPRVACSRTPLVAPSMYRGRARSGEAWPMAVVGETTAEAVTVTEDAIAVGAPQQDFRAVPISKREGRRREGTSVRGLTLARWPEALEIGATLAHSTRRPAISRGRRHHPDLAQARTGPMVRGARCTSAQAPGRYSAVGTAAAVRIAARVYGRCVARDQQSATFRGDRCVMSEGRMPETARPGSSERDMETAPPTWRALIRRTRQTKGASNSQTGPPHRAASSAQPICDPRSILQARGTHAQHFAPLPNSKIADGRLSGTHAAWPGRSSGRSLLRLCERPFLARLRVLMGLAMSGSLADTSAKLRTSAS